MTLLRRAAILFACLLPLATAPARAADACDALTARMIRATGASLAGREGSHAVFRAADAERMSLECAPPRRMVFTALSREPARPFYVLIGLAARALTGARSESIEALALALHQEALLSGRSQRGGAGAAALRCETATDADPFATPRTRCLLVPSTKPRTNPPLRRRAGLSGSVRPG